MSQVQNICNVYRTNPLLQGVRTQNDLQAIDVYCTFAQNMDYGPIPTDERINQRPCGCPYGYGFLDTAYNFSSGPDYMDLGQALNYKALVMKGAPQGQFNGYPNRQSNNKQ